MNYKVLYQRVIVNNSTKIKKNEKLPLTSNKCTHENTTTYGNPEQGMGQVREYGGVKPDNSIPTLCFLGM
jgi:hypothetical protein